MDRYRLATVVGFSTPAEARLIRRFADSLTTAYNSRFLERSNVEVGALDGNASVHMTIVANSEEEARDVARRLIEQVAAASELVVARLEIGDVVNVGPFA